MQTTLSWVHVGDLHMDEADGWLARGRLSAIVADVNDRIGDSADFVFLPGDNANHATPAQYRAIVEELAALRLPYRVIPGDHDFEPGTLAAFEAAFPEANRPHAEVMAGHRCIFVDVVSAGAGGPDFRLTIHHRNALMEELARAEAQGQTPVVFMHAYPGDLAVDGDMLARMFADARVAFVDTGHTHYNELLNDGRVVYGATRSTAQIEEDDGKAGYSVVTVHDRVPSWRFKPIGSGWPLVQIVAPADLRMVTRPADPRQVPRPGEVEITAKVFGLSARETVTLSVAGNAAQPMTADAENALWRATVSLKPGLHPVTVSAGQDRDTIQVLVRPVDNIPHRAPPVAPGLDIHTIGAWPERGLLGTQLGPNKNGMKL